MDIKNLIRTIPDFPKPGIGFKDITPILSDGAALAWIVDGISDRYRGRVMGVFMMNFGLMPLGVLPAAFAIEALGSEMVIALLGIAVLVVATLILVTQSNLREFE